MRSSRCGGSISLPRRGILGIEPVFGRRWHRRGIFEVQFNWIFVLVAGAVILAFFFKIVSMQRSLAEERIAFGLANDLETIAVSAQAAKGTSQRVDLPAAGISFGCGRDCSCSYGIGSEIRPFNDLLMFAPDKVEGSGILFWTLDWKIPFRVTNLVMATNDLVRYFVVWDDKSAASSAMLNRFRQLVPRGVNWQEIKLSDVGKVKNENYRKVKFVFLNLRPPLGEVSFDRSFMPVDVSVAHFEGDRTGVVTFYERKSKRLNDFSSKALPYVDDASFFAALFSDDATMYGCNMAAAFRRLGYLSQVYAARVQRLSQEPRSLERGCVYDVGPLNEMASAAAGLQAGLSVDGVNLVLRAAQSLQRQNDILLRNSCTTVY